VALNIKDSATIRLADELAALTGETKTRTVRVALEERSRRLTRGVSPEERARRLADVLGKPIGRREREAILGYGAEGV
jgi:antitoxin VapB